MKAFTDLEQSKKLAKILPIESADMYYWCGDQIRLGSHRAMDKDLDIPAWSLAALLGILQNAARSIDEDGSVTLDSYKTVEWNLGINNSDLELVTKSNPVDACYEMLVFLHKENLI